MLRRSVIAAVVVLLAALFGAGRAFARPAQPDSVSTAHFVVWYDGAKDQPDYITQTQATQLAAMGENAYNQEVTQWGFNPPPNDGDGKIDVFVLDFTGLPGTAGLAVPDGALPGTGYIDIAQSIVASDWEQHTIAHELFHLIQFGYWNVAGSDHWLLEGEAEWAGYKVDGYSDALDSIGPPELSLDCFDIVTGNKCSADDYENGGYSRWGFYEYLAERYGPLFVRDTLVDAQSAGSAFAGLTQAIAAKGGTFSDVFNDYTLRLMTGGWGISGLDSTFPDPAATFTGGTLTANLGSQTIPVDHLASRYVTFTRGDGDAGHPCFAATLTINVTIPAGTNARPTFYWNASGSTPVALSVNGSTASATVPWDTCFWEANKGYLSLANSSTTIDAAPFVVSASVTVDPNTPAAATAAPAQSPIYGGQTNVDNATVPPAITVFGPLLLQVSTKSPVLRLIVESSGDGAVHATLGSVDLGSPVVRAGNNDLRFTIPATLLSTLRRSSSVSNVLTLTPVSSNGQVTGTVVTRTVSVQAAPKPKPKKKPKKH
jgi:hypothetical protein